LPIVAALPVMEIMIAPPSDADGGTMHHSTRQDFQAASHLLWIFVQRRPRQHAERSTAPARGKR
jgi:hypothetical protein